MLSYQHIYHAGNAADVQKHLWLIRVLSALRASGKPLFWLDTHGGRGLYDLSAPEAQKLGEYREGFLKFRESLSPAQKKTPEIKTYLELVERANAKRKGFYPGSALIAGQMMKAGDSLTACELHKGEIEHLRKALQRFPFARVLKENGYETLQTLTPPPSGFAGGVLIDPSYEVKTEYQDVLNAVKAAHARWPEGVFLVWYPILQAGLHKALVEGLRALPQAHIEETLFREPGAPGKGMAGSGIAVIGYKTP
jgi:23S rRNA (adenine2030-N6)-methyltransferase